MYLHFNILKMCKLFCSINSIICVKLTWRHNMSSLERQPATLMVTLLTYLEIEILRSCIDCTLPQNCSKIKMSRSIQECQNGAVIYTVLIVILTRHS